MLDAGSSRSHPPDTIDISEGNEDDENMAIDEDIEYLAKMQFIDVPDV